MQAELLTFDCERAQMEAAAGVRVCGDEEEVTANGKGTNIGSQLRTKKKEKKKKTNEKMLMFSKVAGN